MEQQVIMVQMSKQEIQAAISEAVAEALKKHDKPKVEGPEFRSRKETAEALHISIATLDNYTSQGLIEASRIGSRILYSRENIEKALQKLESRKWKRK